MSRPCFAVPLVLALAAVAVPPSAGQARTYVASSDPGSFSGLRQADAKYEALVTRMLEATTRSGPALERR